MITFRPCLPQLVLCDICCDIHCNGSILHGDNICCAQCAAVIGAPEQLCIAEYTMWAEWMLACLIDWAHEVDWRNGIDCNTLARVLQWTREQVEAAARASDLISTSWDGMEISINL